MTLASLFFSLPYRVRRSLYSKLNPKEFEKMQRMRTLVTVNDLSYMPFDKLSCIFVHIPKAAGTSISRTLFGNLAGTHTTVQRYQLIFSKDEFESYFKFTFVRNPWDRVFSAYSFLKKGGMIESDKKWAELELSPYESFNDFLIRGLSKSTIQEWKHFRPQSEFLFLPGKKKMQVDYLGFFESLQSDLQYVHEKIGLGDSLSLRHDNSTHKKGKPDYKEFYTEETRDIVAQVYRNDIDIFGYSFDNSSLHMQQATRQKRVETAWKHSIF